MDIWMLICMLFVAMAQIEYAVQLKMRFRKMSKISTDIGKGDKIRAEERCNKIDRYALVMFIVAYIMTVGTYIYKMSTY